MEAAENAEVMEGAQELLSHCQSKGIKVVVVTRNSEKASKRTLEKLGLVVDMVISREHSAPKPSPEPLNMVLGHFNVEPYQMAFVGDYLFDMQAGRAAGVKTILITTQESCDSWAYAADFVVTDLFEVLDLLKEGREARCNVR
jgi:HAD superfamily hydrolase (TIGR01662 family)